MKKTSRFIFLVMICASLAMFTACEYDVIPPEKNPPVIANDTISFKDDVVNKVFVVSCNSCHSTGGVTPDLSPANAYNSLTDYVTAGNPDQSQLIIDCKPGGSMATYCSEVQLALMRRWIIAGAKNN